MLDPQKDPVEDCPYSMVTKSLLYKHTHKHIPLKYNDTLERTSCENYLLAHNFWLTENIFQLLAFVIQLMFYQNILISDI